MEVRLFKELEVEGVAGCPCEAVPPLSDTTVVCWVEVQLRKVVRREIKREVQQSLVSHAAARQALDLYEMKLETLDTRIAKRIMALEARVAELEGGAKIERIGNRR